MTFGWSWFFRWRPDFFLCIGVVPDLNEWIGLGSLVWYICHNNHIAFPWTKPKAVRHIQILIKKKNCVWRDKLCLIRKAMFRNVLSELLPYLHNCVATLLAVFTTSFDKITGIIKITLTLSLLPFLIRFIEFQIPNLKRKQNRTVFDSFRSYFVFIKFLFLTKNSSTTIAFYKRESYIFTHNTLHNNWYARISVWFKLIFLHCVHCFIFVCLHFHCLFHLTSIY